MGVRFVVVLALCWSVLGQAGVAAALEAGVSKVEITPERGVDKMRGMNRSIVVADKIHDSLYAKVVVFKNGDASAALVSLDLLAFEKRYMDAIREGIAEATGISKVICAVTHTHGSGFPSTEVSKKIVKATVEAAREAVSKMVAAEIGFGSGRVDEGYNRRVVKEDGTVEMAWDSRERVRRGPVDRELGVISLRSVKDGSALATLINYAVHPVISMNFDDLIISADYPGVAAEKVESRMGGVCLYFIGAAGDVNPFDAGAFSYMGEVSVFAEVERLGEVVADETVRVAEGIEEYESDPFLRFEALALTLGSRSKGLGEKRASIVEVDTFIIGESVAFVSFPGEPFVELGLDLKRRSPVDLTFVLGCSNDSFAYFPTIKASAEGGYGATRATQLEVGAGELMVHHAVVSLHRRLGLIKELE